jgi:orotate phosphoribosyltransferase
MTKHVDFLKEFVDSEAILRGHFILSSGLHSDTYMQCARVLMDPKRSARLCESLAQKLIKKFGENFADIVVSPAMGGVVVGYELARQIGIQAIFCERVNGQFELRRGFEIKKNQRVLIVEDVITTGKSSLETINLVKKYTDNIIAEACLVDRSNDKDLSSKLGISVVSLIEIAVKTFEPDNIPLELKNIPAIKPGSRFLKS